MAQDPEQIQPKNLGLSQAFSHTLLFSVWHTSTHTSDRPVCTQFKDT